MIEVLKEETCKKLMKMWNELNSLRTENWNKINKENPKKVNLEILNLGTQAGMSETNLTKRIQDIEKGISGIEDMIEEMETSVKEYVKSKKKKQEEKEEDEN